MPPHNPDALRQVMRHWITGVAIVTSSDDKIRYGMTVNSFTSISLDPPLVTVSLKRGARTQRLVEQTGLFGLTILGEDQADISDRFSGKNFQDQDRFAGLEWYQLTTVVPLLATGLAAIECKVVHSYESQDSILYIGEVIADRITREGHPLIYHNREYRQIKG